MPVTAPAISGRQPENAPLTQKQGAFVDAYVRSGGRRTEAAIEAGYSPRYARMQAYELLKHPGIVRAIVEQARLEVVRSGPIATTTLRELIEARSEALALKACKAVLDGAGLKAGTSVTAQMVGNVRVNVDLS